MVSPPARQADRRSGPLSRVPGWPVVRYETEDLLLL